MVVSNCDLRAWEQAFLQQQEAFEERNLDIRKLYGHVISSRVSVVEHGFRAWCLKKCDIGFHTNKNRGVDLKKKITGRLLNACYPSTIFVFLLFSLSTILYVTIF